MNVPIKGWTFTHLWVRPIVKFWFKIYHKSVTYSGTEHINWDKPIIFAPTHQNAFSDALCLILPTRYTNDRFIYPLIRADAFGNSSFIDWLLTEFHMFPVYRPRDKVDLKTMNRKVFDQCHYILELNRNLLIHPEGNCVPEKRIRRLKKGLARIAFGAEEIHDFNLDLQIIPVGINYRSITEPRMGIHIRYGVPIKVTDFTKLFNENRPRAVKNLTETVKMGMEQVAVNIKPVEHYHLLDNILSLVQCVHPDFKNLKSYDSGEMELYRRVIQEYQRVISEDEEFPIWAEDQLQDLNEELKRLKLNIRHSLFPGRNHYRSTTSQIIFGIFFLFITPIMIYGWLNNLLPWYIASQAAEKSPELQFKSSARMTLGLLLFPFFYVVQSTVFYSISGNWLWTFIYLLSLPLTGFICINIWEHMNEWAQQVRLRLLNYTSKESLIKIRNRIKQILSPVWPGYSTTVRPLADSTETKTV